MIRRKLRMQGEAHQSAFAARLDVRDDKQRLCTQLATLEHAYAPRPFSEEHPAIGRPNNRPDNLEVGNDCFDFERALRLRRGFDSTSTADPAADDCTRAQRGSIQ